MDSFTLSRNWFNFSFENPDKIRPVHTAIFFFAIEHCNRLGGKDKFGLPTTMVMEAIGVKSYNTYIDAFTELVEWGFIKLVEKSKNQYSANIIALSKNDKAINKALDKALIKHASKQNESTVESTIQSTVKSIDSIDKQINNKTNKQENNNKPSWKIDFEVYKNDLRKAWSEILTPEYIKERESYHPNLDIKRTLEKACKDFWATEAGWKNKKGKKIIDINWKATFNNSLAEKMNQVWKEKQVSEKGQNPPGFKYPAPKQGQRSGEFKPINNIIT